MKILTHRGHWGEGFQKNSLKAFARSAELGFGTETDVRDCLKKIVISHDMPQGQEVPFEHFLKIFRDTGLPLAINIKANGLALALHEAFEGWPKNDWFVFDMSVPDMLAHVQIGNPVYSRLSDIEPIPIYIEKVSGVWIDGFHENYMQTETIEYLLARQKKLCFVSPELHGRPHLEYWKYLLQWKENPLTMICTDFPEEANIFFRGAK